MLLESNTDTAPQRRTRSALEISCAVWKALFLREAVARLFGKRAAWFWLLSEPLVHILFLMFMFGTIRSRTVGGIHTLIWVQAGVISFLMFQRTGKQSMNAIGANMALFVYRQVKPIDTIFSRALLEGFLLLVITGVLLSGSELFGLPGLPDDPLLVLTALCGLWLLGVAYGLSTSVVTELIPESGNILGMLMTPLYFCSGVIFPLAAVPYPYRSWLYLNPVAHGVEAARKGFAAHYHAAPELSLFYLFECALAGLFLGLLLQVRFAERIVAK